MYTKTECINDGSGQNKKGCEGETHVKAAGCVAQSVFTVVRTCRMVSMCQRWEGAYLTETETHTHTHSVVLEGTVANLSASIYSDTHKSKVPQVVERCTVETEKVIHRHGATKRQGYHWEGRQTQTCGNRYLSTETFCYSLNALNSCVTLLPTSPNPSLERQSALNALLTCMWTCVCVPACIDTVCVFNAVVWCASHLSAALNMPLAACDLRSGGQEERKRSSSFIMERMLEADTSAKERSNARLESWQETIIMLVILHTRTFKMRLCCKCKCALLLANHNTEHRCCRVADARATIILLCCI